MINKIKKIVRNLLTSSPVYFNQTNSYLPFKWIFKTVLLSDPRKLIRHPEICGEEFSRIVSSLRVGKIWKSTESSRHSRSDDLFLKRILSRSKAIILDVGASDGSTSLDLIKKLNNNFFRFYVSDLFFEVDIVKRRDVWYFFPASKGSCFLIATKNLIIFPEISGGCNFLQAVKNYYTSGIPDRKELDGFYTVSLLQKELKDLVDSHSNIEMIEWNMFTKWGKEKVDFIKVANVLNRCYFNRQQMQQAITNMKNALKQKGEVFIVENRRHEKGSLFRKVGTKLIEIECLGGGSEISDLVN